ncbi:MAG TPA: fasciclin domain-containing protein, partial [Draconibacterium sp.]|nr:fasciclin domain-containing protein [Draconibacterium sp.]
MKTISNITKKMKWVVFSILTMLLVTRCENEPVPPPIDDEDLQIMEYLEQEEIQDKYSLFYTALERLSTTDFDDGSNINLMDLLRTRGPFTLFVPTDEAMEAYLGNTSIMDIPLEDLNELVRNHFIPAEIKTGDMSDAALEKANANGDFLVIDFDLITGVISINKTAQITNKDNLCANGYVHEINKVIEVIEKDVLDILTENDEYTIFTQALVSAGLSDTLHKISLPFGRVESRVRYTILAVPDSIFMKDGISSFEILIDSLGAGSDASQYSKPGNPLFQFADYHCLEGSYYKYDFSSTSYYTITRNNLVSVKVEKGFNKFEVSDDPDNPYFVTIINTLEGKNFPAKNGVIHAIDKKLTVQHKSGVFEWQFTDYPDVQSEECYREREMGNFYQKDYFHNVHWGGGDYLQFYYKGDMNFMDNDCFITSDGYWWIEFDLPSIQKGKYLIELWTKTGSDRGNCVAYIDGDKHLVVPVNDNLNQEYDWTFTYLPVGTVNWEETTTHT